MRHSEAMATSRGAGGRSAAVLSPGSLARAGSALVALVALVALMALSGCTSQQTSPPLAPSPSITASRPPADRAVTVSCDNARPMDAAFPKSADVKLESLSFAGLADATTAPDAPNWPVGAGYFYKSGAQLPPSTTVTLSIAADATRYASIATETGADGGALAVTYISCAPATGETGSWWIGGLLLWGKASACVPVEVVVNNDGRTHQALIPLGRQSCPGGE